MTDIPGLLKTIYLGDRACKSVKINGWTSSVAIEVDCISRVRGAEWSFYTDEDLEGGFLVFEGVSSIEFQPPGLMPNDYFGDFRAEPSSLPGRWRVIFEISSIQGGCVEIAIDAAGMHLQDSTGAKVS